MVNHPNRPTAAHTAAQHRLYAEIYVTAFEAGFGFCNYAHNIATNEPDYTELEQQEQDRENYRASLKIVGRRPTLPLGYPFTLSGLGLDPL